MENSGTIMPRNTKEEIRNASKLCKETEILFYGLVILGLPGETEATVNDTIEFIKEIDPFYTQFCFAVPFPNTEIYKYFKEKNLLLTEDWDLYCPLNLDPVIRTEQLSKEDLIRLRKKAYKKILFRPSLNRLSAKITTKNSMLNGFTI